jgi:hypothetical protein
MNSTDELTKRARFLHNAAPREYREFLAVFAEYTARQYEVLIQVTNNWQQAQGHAQQCKKILDVLEEAKNDRSSR